jgi:hypothetical protein
MRRKAIWVAGGLALALVGRGDATEARGSAEAGSAEDDLAVVRRAVARNDVPSSTAMRPADDEKAVEKPATRKSAPQWLRVRVTERSGKKVAINLPLALARAFGDDIPIRWGCQRHRECDERAPIRLGDILKSLDAGQEIVQVDSDDANVRVWVE